MRKSINNIKDFIVTAFECNNSHKYETTINLDIDMACKLFNIAKWKKLKKSEAIVYCIEKVFQAHERANDKVRKIAERIE